MAALGLRRWLSRLRRRNARHPALLQEQRCRLWRYRPYLEQLESRLAPGSLLTRPIVSDNFWQDDGLAPPLARTNRTEDSVKPITRSHDLQLAFSLGEGLGRPAASVPPAASARAPGADDPSRRPEPTAPARFTADAAADLGHTVLEINIFAALESVFEDTHPEGGGAGASESSGGQGGAAADAGSFGEEAPQTAPLGIGADMSPTWNDASGSSFPSFFGGGGGSSGPGQAASVPPAPASAAGANSSGPSLQPTLPVQPSVPAVPPPGTSSASTALSAGSHSAAIATVLPPSRPVLQSVERFGPAGHGRLLVEGSLANTAPLGTSLTLDFFAREPGSASDRLLGSKTVTQTNAGSITFTANLAAEVPLGTVIAAAVHGRGDGADWSQAVELPDGGQSNRIPGRHLPDVVTLPAGTKGESLTLESPGHPLENVQVFNPPGLSDALPMGLVAFTVTNVPVGGSAIVHLTVPGDVHFQHYYKMDPVTGAVTLFDFNGHVGAEIHGQDVTLHLVDGGPGDADGAANGVIVDPGGVGNILPANVDVVPAATTGEMVTLESPAYPFVNVQTYDPPVTGVNLPLGLFGFTITGLPIGGAADVQMIIPSDVTASRYIKQDPVTGALTDFGCCAAGAVTIDGQTITLHLVDGGQGDADGVADGVIVDPSGPGGATITIPCSGLGGTSGWTVFQTGGSGSGQGTVTYTGGNYVITEGNSFDTGLKHDFTIPSSPNILTFDYLNLSFDSTNTGTKINDAFEAAFVDANGNSLVPTIAPGRNAFFNVSKGMQPALAAGVTTRTSVVNGVTYNQVDLDISKLFQNTTGTLLFRLVNNDGDSNTTVSIACSPQPTVTVGLANDTAPTGPGTDQYLHDRITTDWTLTGTAKAGGGKSMAKLEVSWDGGNTYTDITGSLNIDQYTWKNPVTMAPGVYNVTIRATDSAGVQATATLQFTIDTPPVANAGGNQSVNEGSGATFYSTKSTFPSGLYSYLWTYPTGPTSSGPTGQYQFLSDGTYTVKLTVTDIAGATSTDTSIVTVNDVSPVVGSIPDQVISEGGTATIQVSFTDVGTDTHTATINWGDGTTSAGTVSESGGAGTVTGSHVYQEEGLFTPQGSPPAGPPMVTVTDNGGAVGSAPFTVTVNDAPPTLTISGAASVNEGTSYVLTLGATPGPDPVTGWSINWGDGNTSTVGSGVTSASHVYADGPKPYTITATGTTDDGNLSANALRVTVNNIAPAVAISGASSVNEGSTYTLTLSGTPDSVDGDAISGWSITWGDGNTQVVSGNPTSVTHVYLDGPNSYTISASATDIDGNYSSNTLPVTVNHVAPTVTANNLKGQAGQTLTFSGSFTDPGVLDTHTATINWGDGSSNSSGTVTESGGNGTVSATHSYSTANTYTITLTVTDEIGVAASATGTATITAMAINPSISGPSSINEGATYTLSLSFTGSAPTSWSITWGDGNTQNVSGNPSSVNHVYADGPNKYTISATATNSGGTYASNTLAVTVNNIAPAVSISGTSSVNEGSVYTLTLSGTPDSVDSDPITSWKVTWGDGMVQTVTGNPSSVTHTYLDGATSYTISASAIDKDGSYSTNTVTVTVNNVAPTVTANNLSGSEGQSANFLGTFTDAGVLDTHTASINWGDGTSSAGTVTESSGAGAVTGSHYYAETGSYTITLSVTDNDNGTGSNSATATISNAKPTVTPAPNQSYVYNQAFTLQVATFSDAGYNNPAGGTTENYTATINWGDGSATAAGTVAVTQVGSAGVPTLGTVTGTYTYTKTGSYTVTVTVKDDEGVSGTGQLVIHVLAHGPTKFFTVDQTAKTIFLYDAAGNQAGTIGLGDKIKSAFGIATNANMDTLWIVDNTNGVRVFVYATANGNQLGSWQPGDNITDPQSITTNGSDLWILDRNGGNSPTVYFYQGGAGWRSDPPPPNPLHVSNSRFVLNGNNVMPSGLVTDGTTIWVTDNANDPAHQHPSSVFVYNLKGVLGGSWTLGTDNHDPEGITLNPNYHRGSPTDLWVVDGTTLNTYDYAGGSAWTNGSHNATSSFGLASGDSDPEGIADPTLTVQAPAALPQGGSYLVSGQATPTTGAVQDVTINGTAATVDAGNNFFQQQTAGVGVNNLSVTATDGGGSTTSTLTVSGTPPVKASPRNPGAIDFSLLSDVTASFSVSYARTSFNNGTNILYADFTATNSGSYNVETPLLVGVRHISYPSVRVRNNTGLMPDDTPFYDLSSLVNTTAPSGVVAVTPGQSTLTATLSFFDPEGVPFTYDLVFLGHLNHPPRFTSVPVVTVMAGQNYNYQATAFDADGDFLTFSKVSGPANLAFTNTHAGTLTWAPASTDVGTYLVQLRVNDNNGGTADQTFVLSVVSSGINYPPYFTSAPVLDANVNAAYSYQPTAADLDNDALTFSLVSGPSGMTCINGLVQWTPTVSQIGTQSVTLQVTDAAGAYARQSYSILVQPPRGNLPPYFTSTQVTTVAAGSLYVYPARAIDPDGDPVSYTLTQGPGSMIIDPVTGKITWQTYSVNAGNNYPVTILASDGLGGTATQSFTITVTTGGTAPGSLFGTKYNDLNGNGTRDSIWTTSGGLPTLALKQAPTANVPYAMDYHQQTNSMLIVGQSNGTTAIYRVQPDGTELLYASLPGVTLVDGSSMTTVRSDNTAGFTPGDIFVAGSSDANNHPQIIKVSNGGATVTNAWVTLTGTTGVLAAVYLDRTGVVGWDDKLLALVGNGNRYNNTWELWQIDASGNFPANPLARYTNYFQSVIPGEASLLTIPANAAYGPALSGQLVIAVDNVPAVTVAPVTHTLGFPKGPQPVPGRGGSPSGTGLDNAEGLTIVPGAANFFAMADGQASIAVADGSQFAAIQGQIIVAHEQGGPSGWFDRVWYDGTNIQTQKLQFTPDSQSVQPWYEDAFAPIGLGPVAPPALEPGLPNWTIQLINPNTSQVLQSTTTDVNGNYAFTNLAAASYKVAEVQQPGWTQTGPAPVPPGTYTVSLAAGQSITGLVFGNQQNPTPPLPVTTPPSSTPDQPPVFGTTPPNPGSVMIGQTFVYNATATDPESDYPLTFDLPVHPVGMAVDPQLGVLFWQPTPDQLGLSASVLLRVTDTKGSVALQSFTVNVVTNYPPVITSTPLTTAYNGLPYQYTVQAQDAENETLSYALINTVINGITYTPPSGMSITSAGVINWPNPTYGGSGGHYPITVQVSDGPGAVTQTYTLNIATAGANQPPTISSNPRLAIEIGQTYVYVVQASDPNNDPLTYTLLTKPVGMTFSGAPNQIVWTPTASQLGANSVQLQVSDGRGGTFPQPWTITVYDTLTNHPPVITSVPPLLGTVGVSYAYNASGTDPDNDPIAWKLLKAPAGMSINAALGTVRWTPAAYQEGSQSVTLEAMDPLGGSVTQTWTIVVGGTNLPPTISSTPVTQTQVSKLYSYAVQASDPDGDPLTYSAVGQSGFQYSITSTGLLTWTPGSTGSYPVTITVSDGQGNQAVQGYTLAVNASVNQAPVITSQPVTTAAAGNPYTYNVAANDPDGETVHYALSTNYGGSNGPAIDPNSGVLTWGSPVASISPYTFTVTVTDTASPAAQAVQTYTLTVIANAPPTVSNIPNATVTAGTTYRYAVQASDADVNDPLTYTLTATPATAGLVIDSTGQITWTPPVLANTASSYSVSVTVTVTDSYRAAVSPPTFSITVVPDTQAPTVELNITPATTVNVGTQVTFLVFGSDNVGVTSLGLSLKNTATQVVTNVPLDGQGQAVITMTSAATYQVTATAQDAAGNTGSTNPPVTLTVQNLVGTPPTIQPGTGYPAVDAVITAPTGTFSATVSDDHTNGVSYTLNLIPFDGTAPTLISSGSTTTAASLTFNTSVDPTMLANGDYTLELKATDVDDGLSTVLDRHVSLQGHLKLGREQLSVTDLTIPVAGIPITITRTYDSLNAGKSMDFGYGWQLGFGDAQLKVDLVPGQGQQWGDYPAFTNGTRVYVTLAGGEREGFTFTPWEEIQFFGIIDYWHPAFTPDPGVIDQLTVPDQQLTLDANQYYTIQDWGLESYSPADPVYGDQYTVTNLQGLGYQIAADTGKLTGMTARNGNSLTFTPTSVSSNTGKTVSFTRDPAGHITAITDPRGNSVKYGYDANGNLVSVADRGGDPATVYGYDPNHPHYLATIVDPLGVQHVQVSFNSAGRVYQTVDAKANAISFVYDTTARTETVSDPQTPNNTITFDTRGNLKQFVDSTAAQSSATYNNTQPAAMDQPDTITQVRRNSDGTTTSFTAAIGYNAKGQVTSTSDPTGAATYVTYGPFGAVATVSDALGNTVTSTFDTNGDALSTMTAAGELTSFGYDLHNNLAQVTTGSATQSYSYDSFGYLATSTTAAGVTTSFTPPDGNGNPQGSSVIWVNPAQPSQTQTVTTSAVFDANDRQTQRIDVYGHPTVTKYDAKGRVTETDDVLGNATKYLYDAADHVIQTSYPGDTNYPNGTVTDTVYDAEGRAVYTDDRHAPGQADVHGTHTIYDSMGRVTETDRLDGLVITVSSSSGVWNSQVQTPGTVLSTTTSTYNDLGQVTQSTDAAGQPPTKFQYDAAGRQTVVTDPLNETTSTGYDAAGRRITTTDALTHTTQYVYDGDSRLLKTIFADGSFTTDSYDNQGRQSAVTDQMGRTTNYQYDKVGRLAAVVLPAVPDPLNNNVIVQPTTQYTYDNYGEMTSIQTAATTNQNVAPRTTQFTFDAFGHQLTRTLPMGQVETTTYDAYGRKLTYTDFKGQVEKFRYDSPLGRLYEKDLYASASSTTPGETVVYHFDSLGRNDTVTDTIGSTVRVTTYGFDLDNRITSITTPEGTVNYVFDPATGFHTRTYTANSDITYTPDALQRLKTVTVTKQNGTTLGTPLVTNYFYTAVGNIDHVTYSTYPNSMETDYGYDTLNRLRSVTNKLGSTVLSSYVYTLEADGVRTGVTETDSTATVTRSWTYDALKRLTQETYTSTVSGNTFTDQYTYDLVGNRLSKTHTAGTQILVTTDTYNANDQIDPLTPETTALNGTTVSWTTYGYDFNGSLTSVTRTGSNAETDTYTFDLQNRLSTANISRTENGQSVTIAASYNYDNGGFRAQSVATTIIGSGSPTTTTTQFLVDSNNPTEYTQVLEEHTSGASAPSISYIIGLSVLAQTTASGATSILLPDGQGTTRLVTDSSGNILARYAYDAYGSLLGLAVGVVNPPATRILYTGQQFDPVLQEYYLRARYLLPALGRFASVDTFRGNALHPITFHKYAYAADEPITNSDPSGLQNLVDTGIANTIAQDVRAQSAGVYWATYTHTTWEILALTAGGILLMRYYSSGNVTRRLLRDIADGRTLQREVQEQSIAASKAVWLNLVDRNTLVNNNSNDRIPIFVESLSILRDVARVDLNAQLRLRPVLLTYDGTPGNADLRRAQAQANYTGIRTSALDSLEEYPFASTWEGGSPAYVDAVPLWQQTIQAALYNSFRAAWGIDTSSVFLVFIVP